MLPLSLIFLPSENLREKTRTRNPDEFYFKMVNSRVDERGRYEKISSKESGEDKLRSNAENRNLVNLKKSIEMKVIRHITHRLLTIVVLVSSSCSFSVQGAEKFKENLHVVGGVKPETHLLFFDESDKEDELMCELEGVETFDLTAAKLGIQTLKKQRKVMNGSYGCVKPEQLFQIDDGAIRFNLSIGPSIYSISDYSIFGRQSPHAPTTEQSVSQAAEAAETLVESLAKTYESVVQKKSRAKTLDHALELLQTQKNLSVSLSEEE